MKEKCGIAFGGMCAEARKYTAELALAARQFVGDDAVSKRFSESAAKEVCDALVAAQELSPNDVGICVDVAALVDEQSAGITVADVMKEDGALLKAAKLCKNNGMLPYYIIGILAHALLTEGDDEAAAFRDYASYYGIKSAILKYCEPELEPELAQLIADQYEKAAGGIEDDQEKIALMKRAYFGGFNSEKVYKGCAQCTLLTMFQLFGRKNEALFQSASALAAGMALSGDGACGGYSGGIMYMGTIVGRRLGHLEDGDKEAKNESYRMAQMLRDRFIAAFGSVICADVHKAIFGRSFCLRTTAVKNEFEAAGAHTNKCTAVIGTVSAWLAEIIYDCGYSVKVD